MNVLLDYLPEFRDGFLGTLAITASAALLALVLGVLIAGFRVSPVPPLRAFGTAWVTVLRNTPLTLLFLVAFFVVPQILFQGASPYVLATLALGFYTSSFVCEAVRSGITTVPLGQAEAARSLGMSFPQTLRLVVLPQATRTVIPPLSSIIIALTKNSAIAGAFGYGELFNVSKLLNDRGYPIAWIFLWTALAYLVITFAVSGLFRLLERRLGVAR
ncbi:amino acid ABC transporter permease [Streptomyces noursei]|uniref:Amino acid ABC transporter membrane protein 1, PAAT family n=2 Tax=Streptomyces TaxID=1883 RepID=A0A9X8QZU4_9ACTN|nr:MULTISPECIES: amino acid ABC transporter permease [Streptomyces]ANZ15888.1 polar amino acid ABC transporter permease [Streptomyces noursei ATCC 11455]AJC55565.1 polar amino acid ABC transporter C inner membrane subunit [Streptomyces sp. 769]MCZ0993079.1 amino acid ABC transporter permease [Streptomyces noursei]MCZ1018417.1 amino acid ABC transporter permease [Streptomyces noursei]PNE38615.1 amino acid ABC transporter permease [Streptomyces noursei]